ncbi:MAG TPA: hypothetical protein VFV05_18760 [Methylomirabilota bacterium]|nr:hypothetical protein [Methylomirabilota bacterium]
MKLAAKFARQETEEARLARVARRRIPDERVAAIRRMLNGLVCPDCDRTFALPMHLGRHRKARHGRSDAA